MKRLLVIGTVLFMLMPLNTLAQDACEGNFDCDQDVDGTDASVFKSDFGRSQFKNPCPNCPPSAPVPKTGQTVSYYPGDGGTITGDDGYLQKGVAWPNPRFTILYYYYDGSHSPNYVACNPPTVECENPPDADNDMVLDNLTGLYWTRRANWINGDGSWDTALSWTIPWFNAVGWGGNSDWRLPNVKELQSLIDYGRFNPALPSGHPFVNVQYCSSPGDCPDPYWSSTSFFSGYAWYVDVVAGSLNTRSKTGFGYVWPVRGGR